MFVSDIMVIYPRKKGKRRGKKVDPAFKQSGHKVKKRPRKSIF